MTEPKRAEFKLHKTPPSEPDPKFIVRKGEDGKVSIEMNGYTVLGGLSEKAAIDLQHAIWVAVVEPQQRAQGRALQAAMEYSCRNNPFMQQQRSNSFNDLLANTACGSFP